MFVMYLCSTIWNTTVQQIDFQLDTASIYIQWIFFQKKACLQKTGLGEWASWEETLRGAVPTASHHEKQKASSVLSGRYMHVVALWGAEWEARLKISKWVCLSLLNQFCSPVHAPHSNITRRHNLCFSIRDAHSWVVSVSHTNKHLWLLHTNWYVSTCYHVTSLLPISSINIENCSDCIIPKRFYDLSGWTYEGIYCSCRTTIFYF